MKHLRLIFSLLCLIALGCRGLIADDAVALTDGNNRFALDLYRTLNVAGENLFLSPFSISSALCMTYAGARGTTAEEMARTLHFGLEPARLHPGLAAANGRLNDTSKPRGYKLSVANSLWGQQGFEFLPEFLKLMEKHYGAGFREVDFRGATENARQTINGWVEKQTQNKIRELLQRGILSELTRMVLVNAIYFKGTWFKQFDKAKTQDAPFHIADNKEVKVPMMDLKARFRHLEEEDLQVLELPYTGKELSMILLLPKEKDGLAALETSLTADKLVGWLGKLGEDDIHVFLPRFNLTSQFRLDDQLKTLGMTAAFDDALADFSGMNGKKNLSITAVIHKAFVDVNEEGTEAAAATAVVMGIKSVAMDLLVFRADHPFLFLIRNNASGAILFMGRIKNPQANADASAKTDISKPGTYRSGPWEYRLVITGAGSKSQGAEGELFYTNKRLQGVQYDYYRTPWGNVQWVKNDLGVLWGDRGWMLRDPGATGGRELPEPKANTQSGEK